MNKAIGLTYYKGKTLNCYSRILSSHYLENIIYTQESFSCNSPQDYAQWPAVGSDIEEAIQEFSTNLAVHDKPLQEITLLEKSPKISKHIFSVIFLDNSRTS